MIFNPIKLICYLASLSIALLIGCGKTAPDQQTTPKVEPTKATLTPGMEAAKKAHEAGNYREAVRLYTTELAAEEAKPAPNWMHLSYLHHQLGIALNVVGQYDKALDHHQNSLAIWLKQQSSEHLFVASSHDKIGGVHRAKGEYDKALEHHQKALAIRLKNWDQSIFLWPPATATSVVCTVARASTSRLWSTTRKHWRSGSNNWDRSILM